VRVARRAIAALPVATVAVSLVVPTRSAQAHDAPAWFQARWNSGPVPFVIDGTVPASTAFRDRIREGGTNWPTNTSGRPAISFGSTAGDLPSGACADSTSGIHYGYVDGRASGTVAVTNVCYYSSSRSIVTADIVFDDREPWFDSDSTAIPSDRLDLEAVATHEFGHAYGGWNGSHWGDGGELCGTGLTRHTMCPSIIRGQSTQRSPELHDVHTMKAEYSRK